ncbi:MAG: peptide deformylase [Gemmatimonadota bacterium]
MWLIGAFWNIPKRRAEFALECIARMFEITPMTIHRIRLLGDPVLRSRSELITKPRSAAVRMIIDDLRETLRDWQSRFGGGRGIAAPQIGAPVRIVYIEMDKPWALINPEIIDIGTEDFAVWDDCFSFPNLLVHVHRAHRIRIRYQDPKGETHELDLEGDRAELLQHEIDHLDGVLAVDRVQGNDPLCLREEWNRLYAPGDRHGEPEPRLAQIIPE